MQYIWKIHLWSNGMQTVDYTENLALPVYLEDKLDETLDSGEVILENMASKEPFNPKTKFRIEMWLPNANAARKTYDMVVDHDDVEEYVGVKGLYTHRITLIEPSVIAQGMHPDNFALTYELHDVTLNYKTVLVSGVTLRGDSSTDPAYKEIHNGYSQAIKLNQPMEVGQVYYTNSFRYVWEDPIGEEGICIKDLPLYQHAGSANTVTFTIPTLRSQISDDYGNWVNCFETPTITRVLKRHLRGETVLSQSYVDLGGGSTERKCGADNSLVDGQSNDIYKIATNRYFGGTPANAPLHAFIQTIAEFGSKVTGPGFVSPSQLEKFTDHREDNRLYSFATNDPIYNNSKTVTFTTDVLSETQMAAGESFTYQIIVTAAGSLPKLFTITAYVEETTGGFKNYTNNSRYIGTIQASDVYFDGTINVLDLATWSKNESTFIKKGKKYCAYDVFRKAMYTCDSYLVDTQTTAIDEFDASSNYQQNAGEQFPIILDDEWAARMKIARVNETIFENKNLWEIFLQIGYYLHAIPYLEFAENVDKFILKFRQLGSPVIKNKQSTKLTIYNSRNLSEYITQFDSYLTNLFSPQNEIEEYCVVKTSDMSTQLIRADTCEIQLSYGISELTAFDISIGNGTPKSALSYVFEKSIYDILTNDNPRKVRPSKGAALYFMLGDNKIQGMSYVAPQVNGTNLTALKYIVQTLFGGDRSELDVNSLVFHIKYKTQDSARMSQFRPDLTNYMKNSSYEKYPHHEQFYGQQDKIVDSERFTANQWGKLIRSGNNVYQCQEYCEIGNEKESGDLISINDEVYYVTSVENEFYADAIFQKVTYSKNFNQIANIVTIPSEPRFYEVSERSKIRREVRMQEFLTLSITPNSVSGYPRFLNYSKWKNWLVGLLFTASPEFPNYAITRFHADYKRQHFGEIGNPIKATECFPSSDVYWTSNNSVEPNSASDGVDVTTPVLHFPVHGGIVFEWDMADNFQAGTYVDAPYNTMGVRDTNYLSMQAQRYVDIFGRADFAKFMLFTKNDWDPTQIKKIIKTLSFADVFNSGNGFYAGTVKGSNTNYSLVLEKDNREAISFNLQINLLHKPTETDKNDFITFPNLWGKKDSDLMVLLLSEEVSLFDENPDISQQGGLILASGIVKGTGVKNYKIDTTSNTNQIRITFPNASNIDWVNGGNISKVKAIIFYQEVNQQRATYIAKNVANLDDSEKLQSWYIYPVFND